MNSWSIPRTWAHVIGSQARAANEVIKAVRLSQVYALFLPAEIDVTQLRRRKIFLFDFKEDCERDVVTGQFPDGPLDVVCEYTFRVAGASPSTAASSATPPVSTPAPATPLASAADESTPEDEMREETEDLDCRGRG